MMFFSIAADLAHFGAIAVWLGGLAQLAVCLRRPAPDEDVGAVVERFSRIAAIAVAVIVVSGTYLAFRYVPSVPALFTTSYGRLLLLKIAGFAVLLALANKSRQAMFRGITGRGRSVVTAELNRLRLAVGAEVVLGAAVLGLASMLSSISPAG
jgi:copper transport protein